LSTSVSRQEQPIRPKSSSTRNYLGDYFKPLHQYALAEIDRAMVAAQLKAIVKEHGPIAATRARAGLSAFFHWCIAQGIADSNPVTHTIKYQAQIRERVLTPEELAAIYRHAGEGDFGDIIRLLILTGVRRNQIGQLRKSELKLGEAVIELPGKAGRSKNKRAFQVMLSKPALAILEKRTPRVNSEYVFGEGKGGFSGWSKCKPLWWKRILWELTSLAVASMA
jgi:integrase